MKFVLFGDSLTYGFAVQRESSWATLLQHRRIDINFINKGICGDTTSGMLARFAGDVKSEKCKYILIMGGTNDLIAGCDVGVIQGNIMALIHQAYHENIIPILGIQPLVDVNLIQPLWREFRDFNSVNNQISQLRQWILAFCITFGCYYIDIYQCFKKYQGAEVFADGIHPNIFGNELIANEVEKTVTALTGKLK